MKFLDWTVCLCEALDWGLCCYVMLWTGDCVAACDAWTGDCVAVMLWTGDCVAVWCFGLGTVAA